MKAFATRNALIVVLQFGMNYQALEIAHIETYYSIRRQFNEPIQNIFSDRDKNILL